MANILLVDDDDGISLLTALVLRQLGHIVRQAHDGLEALRLVKIEPPDVIITDLNMPRMTGLELIAAVRKDWPEMPVVVFSVHVEAARLSLMGSRSYHLKKPFSRQDLIDTVEQALSPVAGSISSAVETSP